VIISIGKKGEGKKIEKCKGVTLITMYKKYVTVLEERLRIECEEKKMIPQNQTGFRKGMGTMDNIYVVNYQYLRDKQTTGKKEKSTICGFESGVRLSGQCDV